jgi:hypothetical protein
MFVSTLLRRILFCKIMYVKGSPSTAVKLLPCDHEVMGYKSLENSLMQKCRKRLYIRPKVVGPCASGSYVHRAALYVCERKLKPLTSIIKFLKMCSVARSHVKTTQEIKFCLCMFSLF